MRGLGGLPVVSMTSVILSDTGPPRHLGLLSLGSACLISQSTPRPVNELQTTPTNSEKEEGLLHIRMDRIAKEGCNLISR